jgi:hercynylcysteine S-oxide lyase
VLFVPARNQHLVRSGLPTSHGYLPPETRDDVPIPEYFTELFANIATSDTTPFLCVAEALRFRKMLGGEERIQNYCVDLARSGGDRVARILRTEVLENKSGSIRQCAFANVLLPIKFVTDAEKDRDEDDIPVSKAQSVYDWIYMIAADQYDTYFQIKFSQMRFWVRFSGQVYLDMGDFEWAAATLDEICKRVKKREWER